MKTHPTGSVHSVDVAETCCNGEVWRNLGKGAMDGENILQMSAMKDSSTTA